MTALRNENKELHEALESMRLSQNVPQTPPRQPLMQEMNKQEDKESAIKKRVTATHGAIEISSSEAQTDDFAVALKSMAL